MNSTSDKFTITNGDSQAILAYLWRGGAFAHYWGGPNNLSLWFPTDRVPKLPAAWAKKDVYFSVHPCTQIPDINSQGEPAQQNAVRVQTKLVAAFNVFYAEFDAKTTVTNRQSCVTLTRCPSTQPLSLTAEAGFTAIGCWSTQ